MKLIPDCYGQEIGKHWRRSGLPYWATAQRNSSCASLLNSGASSCDWAIGRTLSSATCLKGVSRAVTDSKPACAGDCKPACAGLSCCVKTVREATVA